MIADMLEFQTIFDTYQPKILRYLTRLTGESDAEDLTQETFVKVRQPGKLQRRVAVIDLDISDCHEYSLGQNTKSIFPTIKHCLFDELEEIGRQWHFTYEKRSRSGREATDP